MKYKRVVAKRFDGHQNTLRLTDMEYFALKAACQNNLIQAEQDPDFTIKIDERIKTFYQEFIK